jgi:ribulose-phosphate 3-epimerase
MIAPVDNFVKDFAEAGADIITFHPEATRDLLKTIRLIKSFGKKVGVSLKPESQISSIESCLEQIDLILIMSVNPGFGGQKFIPEVLDKMKTLKNIINEKKLNVDIEIDGGINFVNSKKVKDYGANILVSGSTIFNENNGDLKKNIQLLRTN